MRIVEWKEEAMRQANVAETLKIQLVSRLDDITTRIITLRKDAKSESNLDILNCILNRISIYEEEKRWIKSVLNL